MLQRQPDIEPDGVLVEDGARPTRALDFSRPDTDAALTTKGYDVKRLRSLGIVPATDSGPFDIIGDVHGCIEELRELLGQLGYTPDGEGYGYHHPQQRRLIFVGDLVDRGPGSVEVLRIALAMVAAGQALVVIGNHDYRFLRWLQGRHVRIAWGLDRTIREIEALPRRAEEELRQHAERLFRQAPGYLLLDGGGLVVTHGAIYDFMIGSWSDYIANTCMYGDVEGHTAEGTPIRRDWGAERDLADLGGEEAPLIVYGHNVVPDLRFVNRTIDIDTGCAYGGQLSALRYPELTLASVPAHKQYAVRRHISR